MKKRSQRFLDAKKKIESKEYPIAEAVKLAKEVGAEKFDAALEAHIRLGIDVSKSDQTVKGSVTLPHSTGKKIKIAVFADESEAKAAKEAGAELTGGEDLIKEIKKTQKCDFAVAVATPKMMRSLAQVAKILGPKGLMPNPKTGTVDADPAKVVKELQAGKVNFKNDPAGIIHQMIGKVSFDDKKLAENYTTFLEAIKKLKPAKMKGEYIKNVTLCTSMGPGVKVKK
ncbi:MAG: 50S ribosomal protein L1 [Parcubacteria group bacterium]|nr:50S ribosomal protein L1 [Parcubacteria group bacterium]